jgi:hypothetical protein
MHHAISRVLGRMLCSLPHWYIKSSSHVRVRQKAPDCSDESSCYLTRVTRLIALVALISLIHLDGLVGAIAGVGSYLSTD